MQCDGVQNKNKQRINGKLSNTFKKLFKMIFISYPSTLEQCDGNLETH